MKLNVVLNSLVAISIVLNDSVEVIRKMHKVSKSVLYSHVYM